LTIDEGLIALGNPRKHRTVFFFEGSYYETANCDCIEDDVFFPNCPLERKSKTYLSILVGDFVLPPKSAKTQCSWKS